MVKYLAGKYDFKALEKKISSYWSENNIYQKTKKYREKGKDYYFVDGPPYSSGSIHIGTAWNKILKDTIIRYKRMRGFNIRDQPGYDMHGLPIEVQVEKLLGIKNKKEIETLGIEKFIQKCKQFSLELAQKMTEQFGTLGVWLDWQKPYFTVTRDYIEAAWWTLKKAYDNKLLFHLVRVVPWCPRCETALAEAEIEYWEERDPSIYLKFKLKDENCYLLVWTTTPWTIPANLAVAVHPEFEYIKVKLNDEVLLVLKERLEDILKLKACEKYEILASYKGRELEGLEYDHPLEIPFQKNYKHKVLLAEFVTSERTGLVHIAPGHGEEDFELGEKYSLEPFCPVGENGFFTEEAGKYKTLDIKVANSIIIKDLEAKNLLLARSYVTHRYGHCWRCSTPIIYRATSQWFLRVTALKTQMLEEIKNIAWYPRWAGAARFTEWVSNAKDWCISRQRYWGIPLPIWVCKCGKTRFIATGEELGIEELHRPSLDTITLTCNSCGKPMNRVKDVLDVWFDSAVCSWAQLGYPKVEKDFKRWWPSDWITEGHDQTRGWFYSQLVASVLAFNKAPYKSVLVHGWVLDEKGAAMSKSLGNIIEPEEVIEKYGVDALRLYLLSASPPWEDLPFSWKGVKNAYRMLNIFWNVYSFATIYMLLDKFEDLPLKTVEQYLKIEDRWLLSKLESLKQEVTKELELYNIHKAARALENFVLEDLSRLYIKLVRDRTWVEERTTDKLTVYKVLFRCLLTLSKLFAPLAPFISEEIYLNLSNRLASVHMEDWPELENKLIDQALEEDMEILRELIESVATARQKASIKLRQPIARVVINSEEEKLLQAVRKLESILLEQTNSKKVEFGKLTENYAEVEFSKGKVQIDLKLTPELKAEGLVRELVRRIQEMRKALKLRVEDYIEVAIEASSLVRKAAEEWMLYLKNETRAKNVSFDKSQKAQLIKDWNIGPEKVRIAISKICSS
jgi:isoleucyl-tRNA synthetase